MDLNLKTLFLRPDGIRNCIRSLECKVNKLNVDFMQYFHHHQSTANFRSVVEVADFILYEVCPAEISAIIALINVVYLY